MEHANIEDVTLEFERVGSGEPVVLIHGALIAESFRPLLAEPELTDRYQLVHYHRRGYAGSSPTFEVVSIARQAADCHALMQHLDIAPAHVVGHSLGGTIALQLALDYPEAVHSLCLLEPALMVGASAEGYRNSLQEAIERMRRVGPAAVVHEFLEVRFGAGYRPGLDESVPGGFEQAVEDAESAFESELPGLLNWSFDESKAQHIKYPALCVLGDDSRDLSPRFEEAHESLLHWLPRAEGVTLPNAAHFMQIQNPGDMATALAEFLARHPMSSSG